MAGWLVVLFVAISLMANGAVVFEGRVESKVLATNRIVRIYLPPSYAERPARRYPVLYVHDGQNAFSTVGPNVAFGWGNWELDLTVDRLSRSGKMREIIIVAVDATSSRYADYRGPAASFTADELKASRYPIPTPGDNSKYRQYARFLIEELKPKIDREYRTLKSAKHTGVMGSSMGGVCSLALAWDHPEVFGLAASLSGAFQVEKRAMLRLLQAYDGRRKAFRVYLDSGVVDYTGDDDGRKNTEAVAAALRKLGWKPGNHLLHYVDQSPKTDTELAELGLRHDKWTEAKRSQHNEFYWRVRSWRALEFLFPPKP